ncbi:glycosyltransferase family 9 protein [Rathayibacter sp. KR2-224]|uniref:glycosyltransferase family 9 protein n=1 Tax=Rathayibacter sp. KR2-224 TaxID=3400913 RepID=UPI003C0A1B4D
MPPMLRFTPPDDRPMLLALRALKLGDLLVAVPALKALARTFDDHALVFAAPAWLEPIARLVPGVDALLPTRGLDAPIHLEPGTADIAANLHGNGQESRSAIAALEARLVIQHANGPGGGGPVPGMPERLDPREPDWVDGINERVRWARLVNAFGADARDPDVGILTPSEPAVVPGAVVIHVGAFYGSRQWPVDRFAAVAAALHAEGERVVVTGGDADVQRAEAVVRAAGLPTDSMLAGCLTLDGLAALVAAARLVVSADTGAAHLASAYGTPSVVIFGPAPVEEWGPPPGPHVALTDASVRRGETFAAEPDPALLAVTVDDVLAAAHGLLA